ncbi:MAG: CBS domain-containing protein [Prolixibacteraceae bacterium]|jgi:signal-transduction protein with cAMP-binding, CBS, and nucleotidyltransferase domain|nr:CBS domain-containing protein [Prolixibacteraceae bacterium]
MIAQNLLSEVVPSLRLTDSGQKALNWMEIFRISHLPVVDGKRLVGLISDKIIYDLNIIDQPVGNYTDHLLSPHIHINQHIYEVFSAISVLKLSAVPVLDLHHEYCGVITVFDLAQKFADLVAVQEPGGVIVLELNAIDYSLSQIAQIVEGNDAKILSFYITREPESNQMSVTLKINVIDLSAIIQTFVRYDYNIKAVYMEDSMIQNLYDDRYHQLMKYLNM